ncbi:M48 family metalloprotease [Hymenobacter saemangeumensis]|uniref:M48 family metalloprotease n=1 Tax=Hymenobacter saemangeumensis TaxID=1084522 RepID=A0ABP8IB74_9BACT
MNLSFFRGLPLKALLLPLAGFTSSVMQGPKPDPQVIAQFGLLDNSNLQSFIDDKGQRMVQVSDRPGNYGFTIVDSPVINAFATPDGHVYFTRGIMAHFNSEAQFAGVLGHELGHITARHGQSQQRRSTAAGIGLLLGSIVAPRVTQAVGGIAQQGLGVLFLKYGRDDEREADQLGVKYSTKIGYDASHMADFFQTLQRNEQQSGGSSVPTFLSSHPNSGDRYKTVKNLAAQARQQTGGTLAVNRDQYLRAIDGLAYGNDPRQGFVEGGAFYHPELKFQFPVPQGWKHQNSPDKFQMAEPNGKAMLVLMAGGGSSLEDAAQSLAKQMSLQGAQAQKTTINSFPAIAIQGDQPAQQGQQGGARVLAHLIQDGQTIYALVGLTSPSAYSTYATTFSRVAQGFQRLTDASKLNRQPERIRIKAAAGATSLAQALSAAGVPAARHEELAILNGMQRNDRLSPGQLYKVVAR